MGEETKNAKRNAPLAMVYSLLANGVLGFIMVVTYTVGQTIVTEEHSIPYRTSADIYIRFVCPR